MFLLIIQNTIEASNQAKNSSGTTTLGCNRNWGVNLRINEIKAIA